MSHSFATRTPLRVDGFEPDSMVREATRSHPGIPGPRGTRVAQGNRDVLCKHWTWKPTGRIEAMTQEMNETGSMLEVMWVDQIRCS